MLECNASYQTRRTWLITAPLLDKVCTFFSVTPFSSPIIKPSFAPSCGSLAAVSRHHQGNRRRRQLAKNLPQPVVATASRKTLCNLVNAPIDGSGSVARRRSAARRTLPQCRADGLIETTPRPTAPVPACQGTLP
ncbi:hypothetical protein THAOC_29016 [Thalassiosira oceanica]|uniref:Uncharacterized protein n=1 Tax=Thalassiosira oceanica TaxID=159749 RepID=K0RS93_THAOC|nr:hypothetical protein THAOC_29016 [Thalassiosira oceanica]|eukprot:EJK51786.1 hypothetical protein THAOC_29016 [Thalassiosira oceanica]